jgi:kynurenine formamidase
LIPTHITLRSELNELEQQNIADADRWPSHVWAAGVEILGLDTPSPDRPPFAIHKILLSHNILIIENLTNLQALSEVSEFEVLAAPPKIRCEAAPVRVGARIHSA